MATPTCPRCSVLAEELEALRAQNAKLQAQLNILQDSKGADSRDQKEYREENLPVTSSFSSFSRTELQRYGRQMLVKEFGAKAQIKLRAASVLLVGVGGLGSPVAMYLAAMGVGTLVIVDGDHVDRSNLHRQILHDERGARRQEMKVESAKRKLLELNPLLKCVVYPTRFTTLNAFKLVEENDVVVDASDNVSTRYLVNDACSRVRKPLVSGSALGLEGQVTVFTYENDEHSTGCYRCLYPTPPKVAMSCAENGVVGVVPGVIGCLQAMETVKVITGVGEPLVGVQCFYDAYDGQFRRLKIGKKRNPACLSCGNQRAATLVGSLLGEGNCSDGAELVDRLDSEFRVSTEEFSKVRSAVGKEGRAYALLDTRASTQFEMVHFPEAVNIPTAQLMKQEPNQVIERLRGVAPDRSASGKRIFVICRRGIDSVKVTKWLLDHGIPNVYNINGGYTEYAKKDPVFPMY
ncbi:Adenylyltransferase and sulfurtransferase MOCS3 [Phytophthora citrophthora]|uniref:Adenylyltransferase and sulfurtransferase MOCS3 n=1 Tax=Phytophthora citrophthora TaxID=4793 RepID=A0AAD9LSF9_9STRA|nr:Adenylyltransferase and sulfurtransferase MOCS3 [Phytophthora citrophthora]